MAGIPTTIHKPSLMGDNANLKRLFQKGVNTDVEILCRETDTPIRCHKLILMLHSPVFETILSDRWAKSKDESGNSSITVKLLDDNPDSLETLIGFFYYDQQLKDVEQAMELMQMAHKYDCPHIIAFCSSYIQPKLTLQNILKFYQLACLLDDQELIAASNKFISTNMGSLICTREFLDMNGNSLTQFLEDKDRKTGVNELNIFRCIYNWTKAQCQRNGKTSTNDMNLIICPLLKYVRFEKIDVTEFTERILPKNILTPEETIQVYRSHSRTFTRKKPVIFDISHLTNYSRRLMSSHCFSCNSPYLTFNEIRFTCDQTCSSNTHSDSYMQIFVRVKIHGEERYYMNDPDDDELVVRFQPTISVQADAYVEICWSDKYESATFPRFYSGNHFVTRYVDSRYEPFMVYTLKFKNDGSNASDCPLKLLSFS